MNIVLIGYRGSGKSTVGPALAARLGWPFVDTDLIIEQRAGKTIREIFEHDGEPAFRDLESRVIAEVSASDRHVICAGGGAVLRPGNVAAMKRAGRVIWLTAPPETLWRRIQDDPRSRDTRPNLTGMGGCEEVRRLLEERIPAYRRAADLELDTAGQSIEEIIQTILRNVDAASSP